MRYASSLRPDHDDEEVMPEHEYESHTLITESAAKKLDAQIRGRIKSIRSSWEELETLLARAKAGNAFRQLNFPSWTAYMADLFRDAPLELDSSDRVQAVTFLTAHGMSSRAIGSIVNVDQSTVIRDRQRAELPGDADASPETPVNEPSSQVSPYVGSLPPAPPEAPGAPVIEDPAPSNVIGLDGKTYPPAAPKKPKAKRPDPSAPSFGKSLRATADELAAAISSMNDLVSHDRFESQRANVFKQFAPLFDQVAEIRDIMGGYIDSA